MENKHEVKVTDEWAEDFARRSDMSPKKAKFLLTLVVGFDDITYAISRIFKKKKPKLEDLLDKASGENPHPVQIPDEQGKERPLRPADNRDFKVVWNASTPIGTPTKIEGQCVICESIINNHQNHYTNERETIKICLSCVRDLSTSYESIFNNDQPKTEL
jgi:hypothetical protein